jgi:hypothetical protein
MIHQNDAKTSVSLKFHPETSVNARNSTGVPPVPAPECTTPDPSLPAEAR